MSSTGTVTLALVEQETADITIPMKVGKASGFFTGEAIIRSKPEMKEFTEEMTRASEALDPDAEDFKEAAKKLDEEYLRKMYTGFRGLGNAKREPITGEDAFSAVLYGKYSSYLLPAAITSYYKQYGEALQANLPKRRFR